MPLAPSLLRLLREDDSHLRALVSLILDDLLSRPAKELVDSRWLADAILSGMRASVEDDRTRRWILDQLQASRQLAVSQQGTLAQRVSPEVSRAVKDLLRRPYSPDPLLVRAIVDHRAIRNLMRDMLQTTLNDYAKKVQVPKGAMDAFAASPLSRGRLGQLAAAAGVAAKVVGGEVERQMEGRVKEVVDDAIARSVEIAVRHFCAPEHAQDIAAWRADGFDVAMHFPLSAWAHELDKLDPEGLVTDIEALLRALTRSEAFAGQLRGAIDAALTQGGDKSARDFLEGSGLEEGWRPQAEELMVRRALAFVQTDGFEAWFGALVSAAEGSGDQG